MLFSLLLQQLYVTTSGILTAGVTALISSLHIIFMLHSGQLTST